MRWRPIFIASLLLNGVLGAVWVRHWRQPADSPAPVADAAPAPATNAEARVVVRKQFFAWQEMESPDFRVYIANLAAIGCPTQTIHDIVVGEVNQLYARKRAEEIALADQEWWKYDPGEYISEATRAKLRALDQERRGVLANLLGPDWEKDPSTNSIPALALNGAVLGALPPETKQAVRDLVAKSQQRIQAYLDTQRTNNAPPLPSELLRLRQLLRIELAQVLNPNQLEEFLLRYSQTATDLRAQFRKFDLTPDEFRNLFRACDSLDQEITSYDPANPENARMIAALQQKIDAAIQSTLGPQRFLAYCVATDPIYGEALSMVQHANAPPDAVQDLYNLFQSTRRQQDSILTDTNLTNDQKTQQLKEIIKQEFVAQNQLLGVTQPETPPATPLPSGFTTGVTHPYFPGESLDQISYTYNVPVYDIMMANPGVNFTALRAGQPLFIPQK